MHIVLATRNPHKVNEIRAVFAGLDVTFSSAADHPGAPDVVEDGATLEANALKKARALAAACGLWALADDTGLEVKALGGAPGVYSARYAGPDGDAVANCRKLLKELAGADDRSARFRTVLALVSPQGEERWIEGVCEGRILEAPRGDAGFGYDPLFVPEGGAQSFAEMSAAEKNACSHRGRALRAAAAAWGDVLRGA